MRVDRSLQCPRHPTFCCWSVAKLCVTLCDPTDCTTPGFPVHHHLPEFGQIHVHRVSDAIQPSHPLWSPSPPAFSIRVFSTESALPIMWPEYWSFSFSPSNEYSGLISFRMDWLISLQSKGLSRVFSSTTIKSINFSQLSLLYGPTLTSIHGHWKKTIPLTRRTFVGKVMSLLFNMLSRLVITCLPRSKRLLISWLQSASAVILGPPKIKSATVSPSIYTPPWVKQTGSGKLLYSQGPQLGAL